MWMTLAHVRIGRQVSDVEVNTEQKEEKKKNTKQKSETNDKCASAFWISPNVLMSGDSERFA